MITATKSIVSYSPKRARANRTRSWMRFNKPTCVKNCATTVTSPNHEGREGAPSGSIWTFTDTGVILALCSPCLKMNNVPFFLLRRHISCVFVQFTLHSPALHHLVAHLVGK